MQRRRIGLIGGISWHSTAVYYQKLNQIAGSGEEPFASADFVLRSINFQTFVDHQKRGEIFQLSKIIDAARRDLYGAGADLWAVASNTGHLYLEELGSDPNFISIYDAVADWIHTCGIGKVGLFGTRYVMAEGPYATALRKRGIDLMLPPEKMAHTINKSIFLDLAHGRYTSDWKHRYLELIDEYKGLGAEAVILGCTEIPTLMQGVEASLPLLDTVKAHVESIWTTATANTSIV